LREGDASTKFVHIHANARWWNNGETLIAEERKAHAFHDFYDDLLGTLPTRSHKMHLDLLDLPQLANLGLIACFNKDEIWSVISAWPPDKAPRPDRFTALFLQSAWPIIPLILCEFLMPSGSWIPEAST
jgi:hypothetical protein